MADQWLVIACASALLRELWLVMAGTRADQWLVMADQWLVMASNGCQWPVSEIRTEKLFLFVSDHYITISDVCIFCQSEKKSIP